MRFVSFLSSFYAAWRDYPAASGTVLGNRYVVQEVVGQGSYGLTYKCVDRTSGSLVAVKQARPSKGRYGKRLLEREAMILKALPHPRFPAFIEWFTGKGNAYLAMSFLQGDTFEDLIFELGHKYGERECVRITRQLLELVMYSHAKGYVHLDLRIPNVLVKDGEIYLIDFGLARKIGEPAPNHVHVRNGSGQRGTASRQFKAAEETSDLLDIGHFMLFLLYSAYVPEKNAEPSEERSWQDELALSSELKTVIERLLELREPYSGSAEFMNELESLSRHTKFQ